VLVNVLEDGVEVDVINVPSLLVELIKEEMQYLVAVSALNHGQESTAQLVQSLALETIVE
jgi:hypothetical protein